MINIIKILTGILILIVGYFLGLWLARITQEELKAGQKWFKLIIIMSAIGALISLIFRNDVFLFSFLFIAIATIGSLKSLQKKR